MFNASGAVHHVGWMEEDIYRIKIFLIQEEFKLTKQEESSGR